MPLARRLSNCSVASASSSQSFPATIESSTKISKAKVGKIMTRRRSRKLSALEDKSNQENLLQSPTPYWKVAKERGRSTPPKTRSSKKRKAFSSSDPNKENSRQSGLLVFSPPDQKENARREKEELEQKEQARAKRVRKARNSGQLLVFSPTFRNPAPLPVDTVDNKQTEDDFTNMEVNVAHDSSEKSQLSLVTAPTHGQNSEQITNELKNLRETIDKLVQRKSNENEASSQQVSLEAHIIRTEGILKANSKLEDKIERLEEKIKTIQNEAKLESQRFIEEKSKMEIEIAEAARDSDFRIEALQKKEEEAASCVKSMQNERDELLRQISELQDELKSAKAKLKESKAMAAALKDEMKEEKKLFKKQEKELKKLGVGFENEVETLRKGNKTLQDKISELENTIDKLENCMLPESEEQLRDALNQVKTLEEVKSNYSEEVAECQREIAALKEELKALRIEQEEERKHFQELNEGSTKAYNKMKKEMNRKDKNIEDLEGRLQSAGRSLESQRIEAASSAAELQALRTTMDSRVNELEQALQDTTLDLEALSKQKILLEKKLAKAEKQIEKEASFKEEVLMKNDETCATNNILHERIAKLQHELKETRADRDHIKQHMETFDERETDLLNKLRESDRVRRGLHNRVMQLCGNIRVYVRVRPVLDGEQNEMKAPRTAAKGRAQKKARIDEADVESPFSYPGMGRNGESLKLGADDPTKNLLEVREPKKDRGGLSERRKKWTFGFDNIFKPSHGQDDIWEATEPLVQSAVDGYNVTIFAYGQTGSGKTYTMLGEQGNEGVIARSIQKLFGTKREIEELNPEHNVEISVELLEVYNEKIRDLLVAKGGSDGEEINLKVKANEAIGSTILGVQSESEVLSVLNKAQTRRSTKATASNAVSSRSHMIFTLRFQVSSPTGMVRIGRLNVCDLAGSERLGKSRANEHVGGALLSETKHINTSLSVLSNVIEKLQAGDSNVPFRESKLTHLLQNSLGGNSKTLAIVCCNPLQSHFHESLCSLRFAAKVNKVDLKAVANFSA